MVFSDDEKMQRTPNKRQSDIRSVQTVQRSRAQPGNTLIDYTKCTLPKASELAIC